MTRLCSFAIATLVATTTISYAETQAELAARENEEGKELMYRDKFAEAAKKFAQASARVPEAKYFINLCTARLNEGQLSLALTACNAAELNSPTAEQKDRAEKLIARINEEAKKQGVKVEPVGGGGGGPVSTDTAVDPGQPAAAPTVVQPLAQNLVVAGPPEHRYTWTIGFDAFVGGGQVGEANYYGTAFGGIRFKGDYLFDPDRKIGGEVYFQYSHLGPGADEFLTDTLDIFDIGVAAYKHFCPGGTPRLCFTPLAGVHLSLMSPAGEMDSVTGDQVFNYAGVGGRLDGSMEVAFGRRYEHVFSIMVGANIYSPVLSENTSTGSLSANEAGLDVGGAAGYFGIGYTYRFNSPLGRAPFIILE